MWTCGDGPAVPIPARENADGRQVAGPPRTQAIDPGLPSIYPATLLQLDLLLTLRLRRFVWTHPAPPWPKPSPSTPGPPGPVSKTITCCGMRARGLGGYGW